MSDAGIVNACMIRKRVKMFKWIFLSLIVYSCMLTGCNATTLVATHGQSEWHTFIHNGIERTYSIYIPEGVKTTHPVPLLVALHGGDGSAEKWPIYTNNGFERLADREGFILVYPNGLEGHWNDGRGVQRFYSHREDIDDTDFLVRLIDGLSKIHPIDTDCIYVVGVSNGGMLTHKLAAEYSDKVTAIATVISAIPKNLEGKLHPTHPVSVLMINGTEDPLVRWVGGPIEFGRKMNGYVISIDKTVSFWTKHNNCTSPAETKNLPDLAPDDGTRVSRTSFGDCKSGAEVVIYKIDGGGHTWPAYQENRGRIGKLLIDKLVGKRSRDIDACEVIWQFFKDHQNRRVAR